MLAQDQAQRNPAGATVEVIGYDDEAVLKLLSLRAIKQVGLEFTVMDTLAQRGLYAFMHQDPSHPSPGPIIPALAGGPVTRAEDKYLQ
jgi:hypothetical protein